MAAAVSQCCPQHCDFLKLQPKLYCDMMRVAVHWRRLNKDALGESLPESYLVKLLMLHARQRQQPQQRFVTGTASNSGSSSSAQQAQYEQASEDIFRVFLATAASLPPATFITWYALYTRDAMQAFMQSADGIRELLPRGPHPVVMDPANPTNTVAAGLWDVRPPRELAEQLLLQGSMTAVAKLQQEVAELSGQLQRCGLFITALAPPGCYISAADQEDQAVGLCQPKGPVPGQGLQAGQPGPQAGAEGPAFEEPGFGTHRLPGAVSWCRLLCSSCAGLQCRADSQACIAVSDIEASLPSRRRASCCRAPARCSCCPLALQMWPAWAAVAIILYPGASDIDFVMRRYDQEITLVLTVVLGG